MENKQIKESAMIARFQVGEILLPPLVVQAVDIVGGQHDRADARIKLGFSLEREGFKFAVESKARSTPQSVQWAMAQARSAAREDEWPMIQVPYLSMRCLDELEKAQVSGVDLCGNGVVIVPERVCVVRSGQPNLYRDSRPLINPYRGRSSMVARLFVMRPHWDSLTELTAEIRKEGVELSLSQTSKAVQALTEEMIVSKNGGRITLTEPLRLLDHLAREWQRPKIHRRQALRLESRVNWPLVFSSNPQLKWAVTGECSAARHAVIAQGGPLQIAVSSLALAEALLKGSRENVPSFADLELIETIDEGLFFANEVDMDGIRWAGRLQTWLELQAGDARQQEAARDIRTQILEEIKA